MLAVLRLVAGNSLSSLLKFIGRPSIFWIVSDNRRSVDPCRETVILFVELRQVAF
jgi:hypothetical protein